MALTDVQKIRIAVADMDVAIPFLDDSTYLYFLEKNDNSLNRASLDAARTILLMLAQRTSSTVDVLSFSGQAKAAEQYRLALQMFLRDPSMNPVLTNCQGYAGGISISDMQANVDNTDNNYARVPDDIPVQPLVYPSDYFRI